MSEVNGFDPETAPLEELRAQANTEVDPEVAAAEAEAAKIAAAENEEPVEEEVTIYQRRIDLGDGSGVQVFNAGSMEELVDKLVTAQENATKKIRELNAAVPKPQVQKERSADEEFVLSQE